MRLPVFPCILAALDIAAAIEALWRRCPASAVYWLSAALLTGAVMAQQMGAR